MLFDGDTKVEVVRFLYRKDLGSEPSYASHYLREFVGMTEGELEAMSEHSSDSENEKQTFLAVVEETGAHFPEGRFVVKVTNRVTTPAQG
jgi:hypothetical protein